MFGRDELYLTLGAYTDTVPYLSDYTGRQIFYRSIRDRVTDHLTVRDYLWRWDTDWFWCSKALGAQHPLVRRLWPKRYLRSDVYRKIVALDRRYQVYSRLTKLRRRPASEPVIQDVEIPIEHLPAFLDFFTDEIGISPVWLCPLSLRDSEGWPLYPIKPGHLYVNVGFWATVELGPDEVDGTYNRRIERKVTELGGHKSLYSTSYFDEDEFWAAYDGESYRKLKKTYDPDGRLPDLYSKCVRNQ
jgi:FAD/FMN-containing dehydrogenase